MKEFDKFTPFLDTCEKIGNFRILGLEGDLNEWHSKEYWFRGTSYQFQSYKDRKDESNRSVGTIITFDERSKTYSEKNLYRNTKGVYFKGLGYETNLYILRENLPENMK